ncbi:MAG: class I SAM-dependent methyltransferase [Sphingobacteriaceae bacterium]|nr:MAG: class I SAM-dependent methyltransferase [Sphingobacteriaceae bacterium]
MPANYDRTARFYDRLSRLVYGDALQNAQKHFLHLIPAKSQILIIGGGTGKILENITALHPSGLSITYVEISANMIALSRNRNTGDNYVEFITKAIENTDHSNNFDVVITPFLFDNYTDKALKITFPHISSRLKPGGLWLNTDFQLTGKWWQWVLLKSMYGFFKLFSKIEAKRLPDMKGYFEGAGYSLVARKPFYGDFVVTEGWRKI